MHPLLSQHKTVVLLVSLVSGELHGAGKNPHTQLLATIFPDTAQWYLDSEVQNESPPVEYQNVLILALFPADQQA